MALVADKGVAAEHSQWRNPELKSWTDATRSSAMEGVEAATSARVAEERNRQLGKEIREDEEKSYVDMARGADATELKSRRQVKMLEPMQQDSTHKAVVNTRWVLTWAMAGGKKSVKARLVAKGYQNPNLRDGSVLVLVPLICGSSP